MTGEELSKSWASRFGLARVPLFSDYDGTISGTHDVLLDGGYGSFALSATDETTADNCCPADWSWSSNIPHHVTITPKRVTVVRWDNPHAQSFTRESIERKLDSFYQYLTTDRITSNQRVIDHMLLIFRRIRSLLANEAMDDIHSTDTYLSFLSRAISRSLHLNDHVAMPSLSHPEGDEFLNQLPEATLSHLFNDFKAIESSGFHRTLFPTLAIRHAGSQIFQEAHFELMRNSTPDLWGNIGPAESRHITRGGAHFTPPALARCVVEQAISNLTDIEKRDRIVILDPACGSGAFLHEAVRTLRKKGFFGEIKLIGRDISAPAVSMARFVLRSAIRDWGPSGRCVIDILQADSITDPLPSADVVLMNPPFVAWPALSTEQKENMSDILGQKLEGRGDYSMAFVVRAAGTVVPGGVIGAILPASLLNLQAASKWRTHLLDTVQLRLVASLGDYGLFTHAQVQVALVVFSRPLQNATQKSLVSTLITTGDSVVTGNALRELRRVTEFGSEPISGNGWSLFQTPTQHFRQYSTWRLISPRTETALTRLLRAGRTATVEELFHVRQGVLTGLNSAFVLDPTLVNSLPDKEQQWFKIALTNESISEGTIKIHQFLFYPYNEDGLLIENEDELLELLPRYYASVLHPHRDKLKNRSDIIRSGRSDWWGLSQRRRWAVDSKPKLVSKYFGRQGSFAIDREGKYIVLQGYAWFPKWEEINESGDDKSETVGLDKRSILSVYRSILNSRTFSQLLGIYSTHVAGGQFNLSARYVNEIPIPNIPALASDTISGEIISRLASLGDTSVPFNSVSYSEIDKLTEQLYGDGILD